jgi:hypothetical protein
MHWHDESRVHDVKMIELTIYKLKACLKWLPTIF